MKTSTPSQPKVASRDEWLAARKALLVKEKAMSRELDVLRAERRQLPWVRIEKPYVFEGPQGPCTLADLFRGRNQLAVYHFMLTPGSDHVCKGCSYIADHIDGARQHFEHADLAFAAISRAPLGQIEQVRRRMRWTFPWLSSNGTEFNYDFGVSFKPEDIAAGRASYNYGSQTIKSSEDMHGTSIFAKNERGEIFHSYSTYARGDEVLMGAFAWLDLAPKGRNETDGVMSWLRLHDEYEAD
ncbi:MAG TPA: thioredoxin family protein [Rhodanobacter sp.]|nr:thioredoxin family protein [Rhodanobacter sp.]